MKKMRNNTSHELYIPTENFSEIHISDIIEKAIEYFGPETTVDDLTIASERFLERGCSCCHPSDDEYDLYFCVYLRK